MADSLEFEAILKVLSIGGVPLLSWYGAYIFFKKWLTQLEKALEDCHMNHAKIEAKYDRIEQENKDLMKALIRMEIRYEKEAKAQDA